MEGEEGGDEVQRRLISPFRHPFKTGHVGSLIRIYDIRACLHLPDPGSVDQTPAFQPWSLAQNRRSQ